MAGAFSVLGSDEQIFGVNEQFLGLGESNQQVEKTPTASGTRESMFLAFQYGVMYVLSFATIIAAFAAAIALVLLLVMIVCRSGRLFR